VGFSYSNTSSDYNTDDSKTAADNFAFLEGFLMEYPDYIQNPIYLAGESYAGTYIPTVTQVIIQNPDSLIYQGLVGLSLGNPVIFCVTADYVGIQFNLFYWHGLVSHIHYANWTSNNCDKNSNTLVCNAIFTNAVTQIGVIYQQLYDDDKTGDNQPSLDPDDLYQNFCTGNGTLEFTKDIGYPNQCNPIGNRVTAYLNRKDVQKYIGARPTNWMECANLNYTISRASMIPLYQSFFQQRPDLSILIYSGDVDIYTVPFGYTLACLSELKENPTSVWQPWFVNGATAGYFERYPHYTYVTVKGAGHETPQYQPLSSYYLFQEFLAKGSLPNKPPKGIKLDKNFIRRKTQGMMLKEYGIKG